MGVRVLPEIQLLKCCLKRGRLISGFILFEHLQEMRIKLMWFSLSFGIQMHFFLYTLKPSLPPSHFIVYIFLKKNANCRQRQLSYCQREGKTLAIQEQLVIYYSKVDIRCGDKQESLKTTNQDRDSRTSGRQRLKFPLLMFNPNEKISRSVYWENLLKSCILQWLAKRNYLARAKGRHIKSKNWN